MLFKHQYQFSKRMQMHDITQQIQEDLKKSQIKDGIIVVYTPHTTAGITINENADPDVVRDMLNGFEMCIRDSNIIICCYDSSDCCIISCLASTNTGFFFLFDT